MSQRTPKSPVDQGGVGRSFADFDFLPDAVFALDPSRQQVVAANAAALARWGLAADELAGTCLEDMFPETHLAELAQQFDAAESSRMAAFFAFEHCHDDKILPVQWHVALRAEGESQIWLIVSRAVHAAAGTEGGESWHGELPSHDPLTGLPDRRLFARRLRRAIDRTLQHADYLFAVCFLDLDQFKGINDRWGHLAGDQVLCEVARRMVSCLRPGDMVARFGGDEFTILLDDLHEPAEATIVARRILERLDQPLQIGNQMLQLQASIGISTSVDGHHEAHDMLRAADGAMYRVKAAGGGNLGFFSPELTVFPPWPR